MKHKGILVVVSGFSGAGKGTLMKKLIQEYDNYALSISMTTRMPREGEENGREYFFVRMALWNMPAIVIIITVRRKNMWKHSWLRAKT